MGEVFRNSVSVTATSSHCARNEYAFKQNRHGLRICFRSFNHFLELGLAIKPRRKLLKSSKKDYLSVSAPRRHIPDSGSFVDCSSGIRSVIGMELDLLSRNEEENHNPIDQNLEFPRDFSVHCGIDSDFGSENDFRRKPDAESKTRLHFLEQRDAEMLSKRLLALSRCNKIRSALELFESMKYSGLKPDTHSCNSLLTCLLRKGNLDRALSVFATMRVNKTVTGHTYSLLLKAIESERGYDAALNVFAEWEMDCERKDEFDVIVYNTMISICGRMNDSHEVERVWRSMKENGYTGNELTYSLLISIFVRSGRNELALDAYDEMIRNELCPREDAMRGMIGAFTKEGKWDLALRVLRSMLNNGLKPNLVAFNELINSLGKAGRVELAFEVYGIAKSLGYKPDEYTWNALMTALYRANRFSDALHLFDHIRSENESQLNEHLYSTALMSCQKFGSWERALKLLWEMEGSGLSVSTSTYNLVIGACETARKPKVALRVYEHMVDEKRDGDTFTHLSLIKSCIWGSLWDNVEEILERVEPDVSLYNAAIHGMCLRGEIKSAKKLYMKMRDIGLQPDGKTRALMLQNLKRKNTK